MEQRKICQSCSMPMDTSELFGTEKDGRPNTDYCKYCYQQGAFTSPGITLQEMKDKMSHIMDQDKLPADILEEAIGRLPLLKRWRTQEAQ
jgi:hypothetical protein